MFMTVWRERGAGCDHRSPYLDVIVFKLRKSLGSGLLGGDKGGDGDERQGNKKGATP
jgi:hypothetical protein